MKKVQIAIVGAGPAGLSLAIELSNKGYSDIIVFDREDEAGGTPRHCGHLGFGIFEFYRLLSGPQYAKKLVKIANDKKITIKLKHTLVDIDDDKLIFSTNNGLETYNAQKTILALGARETPRPPRFITGIRSPNIITTGALQRFTYLQKQCPFKNAVIVGSEIVSFSAIMSAKHAGMEVKALIEEDKNLNTFSIIKTFTELFFNIPVKVGYEIVSINGENKNIQSITISKDGNEETIECDGIIFSGKFAPESEILQKSFKDFNYTNNSLFVSQAFQTTKKDFFAVGNILRGALTAFKCYFEGKRLAKFIDDSLKNEKLTPLHVKIQADENIQWFYPSLIDLNYPSKTLTNLRLKKKCSGNLVVYVNKTVVYKKQVNASTFQNIKIPRLDFPISKDDTIYIRFED
ncbi:NAD(P)/FAD-dependent oxidoreductase [Sulfurospirillum sp. 1307]|jgi:thioredoxin reductase